MTLDAPLVLKKLARIETCVTELRALVRPDEIETDLRSQRFAEHTLQIAIQAALDAASHVVAEQRMGEPRTNRELFTLLARGGAIDDALAAACAQMAGFRNVLVHEYEAVDLAVVREVVEHRLPDLLAFAATLRAYLTSPPRVVRRPS